MAHIEKIAEPMLGPNVVKTTSLQLLSDGETIVLAVVCQSPAVADEIYAAMARGLTGSALRVADLFIRRPRDEVEAVHG